MGKDKQRKENKVKAKAKAKAKAKQRSKQVPAGGPASVNDLPDELLDVVLLNLGSSPLHLIRAAATCRRWRRAIADAGFLSRSRALHGRPPVAGRYHVTDSLPPNSTGRWRREAKKPAAFVFVPLSPAVVDAGHFSLDFLYVPPAEGDDRPRSIYYSSRRPRHNRSREIIDSRGSLLLLTSEPLGQYIDIWGRRRSSDLIVCEPLSRRYQGIACQTVLSLPLIGTFLLDGVGSSADGDAMSNFRVLSMHYAYARCQPRACVFTPGSDGGWRICRHTMDDDLEVPDMETIHFAGRRLTARKLYWGMENSSLLVLDESTLKFSLLTFPAPMPWPNRRTSFRVVDDGGDVVRAVRMDGVNLEVFCQLPDSGEWVIESSIILRDATKKLSGWEDWFFQQPVSIVTADNTLVVLTPRDKTWLFSVDLETMEVDNEHVRNRDVGPSYPCALPWPPALRACVDHGKKRHTRKHRSP